jgi:hypothetical protein
VSAGQGGGVGQAYDRWRVVSQLEFQQWVESELLGEVARDSDRGHLSLITLLLSNAEFDAPVLAKSIFDRTDTAAFRCPVFAGQGM